MPDTVYLCARIRKAHSLPAHVYVQKHGHEREGMESLKGDGTHTRVHQLPYTQQTIFIITQGVGGVATGAETPARCGSHGHVRDDRQGQDRGGGDERHCDKVCLAWKQAVSLCVCACVRVHCVCLCVLTRVCV